MLIHSIVLWLPYVKIITIITHNFKTLKCIQKNLLDLPFKSNFIYRGLHVDKQKRCFSCNRVLQFNGKFNTIFGEMDFHTEFAMVLLFVYAFQNWGPFTNIHSNIQIHTCKHTTARTNLLVGTKIYALHIACIETDLSLMNVFHLSLMIEKHDIQPFDIFPFCSLQSSSCRNWNDLTHIFFLNYQGIADEDFIFAAITIIVCFPNK